MVIAALLNLGLDCLFVFGFRWGIVGAAAATATSQLVGGVIPLVYFGRKNTARIFIESADFGAFVAIGNKEGLVHISNMANHKVKSVGDIVIFRKWRYCLRTLGR